MLTEEEEKKPTERRIKNDPPKKRGMTNGLVSTGINKSLTILNENVSQSEWREALFIHNAVDSVNCAALLYSNFWKQG
jgi:hypothetical protein